MFLLLCLRPEERLRCVLGGRSQRWIPGLVTGRGSGMATGGRERPHLPAEAGQLGSAHAYSESLKHSSVISTSQRIKPENLFEFKVL